MKTYTRGVPTPLVLVLFVAIYCIKLVSDGEWTFQAKLAFVILGFMGLGLIMALVAWLVGIIQRRKDTNG